jgi:myo-inositol-1(or 4)-monophosphatase
VNLDDRDRERYLDVARVVVAEVSTLLAGARPAEIRTKGDPNDLVTEWDTRAEDLVRERLRALTPELEVLGEERGGEAHAVQWCVDPIDGTVNFAHGLPVWAVSLALLNGPHAEVGAITAPALGWSFWGRRGGGARWRQGAEEGVLAVSTEARLAQAMLASGFPYDRATNPNNNFRQWDHFQRVAGACRRLGAASLDLCFVARGWFDGYWERGLKPWDVAAGALFVEEAGGRVTDALGGACDVNKGEVVASNGAIHAEMLIELAKADAGAP